MNNERISMPDLHDGELIGMALAEGSAAVFVRAESGRPFTIRLEGVYRFEARDIYEGNIIFDCEVLSGHHISDDALSLLLHTETPDRGIPRLRAKNGDNTHQLLLITPSYGATLAALATTIFVEEGFALPWL